MVAQEEPVVVAVLVLLVMAANGMVRLVSAGDVTEVAAAVEVVLVVPVVLLASPVALLMRTAAVGYVLDAIEAVMVAEVAEVAEAERSLVAFPKVTRGVRLARKEMVVTGALVLGTAAYGVVRSSCALE